jgi:hypothetical protein
MSFTNGKPIGLNILANFFILRATVGSTSNDVWLALRPQPTFKTSHFIAAETVLLANRSVNPAAYRHIHSNRFMSSRYIFFLQFFLVLIQYV